MNEQVQHTKTLRQRDMVLFTVSAILLLDTLTAAASVGAPSIFWWLLLGMIFFTTGSIWCLVLVYGATWLTGRLLRRASLGGILKKATGALFVALGIKLAISGVQ